MFPSARSQLCFNYQNITYPIRDGQSNGKEQRNDRNEGTQAGDLRSIYGDNTVKIRREYGCKSPAWITEKYGPNTAVYGYVTFVYRAP